MLRSYPSTRQEQQELEEKLQLQNDLIQSLQEKLDAFMVNDDTKSRPWCTHCSKPGHSIQNCWWYKPDSKNDVNHQQEQRDTRRRGQGPGVIDNFPPPSLPQNSIPENGRNQPPEEIPNSGDKRDNVYCTLEGDDGAVLVNGFVNRKKADLLIDTGAGPCVTDLIALEKLNISRESINRNDAGRQLSGVGNANVIGTIKLDVSLHRRIKRTHEFKVVNDIGGAILIGRSWLSKFESLKIDWKTMTLKIEDIVINGKDIIQGGSPDSREFVASITPVSEDSMKRKIREKISGYEHLNSEQKRSLTTLLLENADLFIKNTRNPPQAHLVSHIIDTSKNLPVRDKMRRFSPDAMKEIDAQVQEMIQNGICRPSNSPWSSQVLLARKKDGTMRFVIDYRKLNDLTVKDDYPIPNMKDLIDDIEGSQFFSCMDMPSAYWHIPMDEESIPKSAF